MTVSINLVKTEKIWPEAGSRLAICELGDSNVLPPLKKIPGKRKRRFALEVHDSGWGEGVLRKDCPISLTTGNPFKLINTLLHPGISAFRITSC